MGSNKFVRQFYHLSEMKAFAANTHTRPQRARSRGNVHLSSVDRRIPSDQRQHRQRQRQQNVAATINGRQRCRHRELSMLDFHNTQTQLTISCALYFMCRNCFVIDTMGEYTRELFNGVLFECCLCLKPFQQYALHSTLEIRITQPKLGGLTHDTSITPFSVLPPRCQRSHRHHRDDAQHRLIYNNPLIYIT